MKRLWFLVFLFFPHFSNAQMIDLGIRWSGVFILPVLAASVSSKIDSGIVGMYQDIERVSWWPKVLRRACSCESTGSPISDPRQFDEKGNVIWSNEGTNDVGACQINLDAHQKEITELGLDVVNSYYDNIVYAKILYLRDGVLKHWWPSRKCWQKK